MKKLIRGTKGLTFNCKLALTLFSLEKLQEKYEGKPAPDSPWLELKQAVEEHTILIRETKLPLGDISRRVISVHGIPASQFQLRVTGGNYFPEADLQSESAIPIPGTPIRTGKEILQLSNVIVPSFFNLRFSI